MYQVIFSHKEENCFSNKTRTMDALGRPPVSQENLSRIDSAKKSLSFIDNFYNYYLKSRQADSEKGFAVFRHRGHLFQSTISSERLKSFGREYRGEYIYEYIIGKSYSAIGSLVRMCGHLKFICFLFTATVTIEFRLSMLGT